jgi:hypothetical protein
MQLTELNVQSIAYVFLRKQEIRYIFGFNL